MTNLLRRMVSQKKRRTVDYGLDLDLVYVNPRIIAMGLPASGSEGLYRNPISATRKFLDIKHEGHYRVYNLCSERTYSAEKLGGNVRRYPFDDHQTPPLQMIVDFCRDVEDYLEEHEDNTVCIHCLAGKGRTGMMICAYLVYGKRFALNPEAALKRYAEARTKDCSGISVASQRRYVRYTPALLQAAQENQPLPRRPMDLSALSISGLPKLAEQKLIVVVWSRSADQRSDGTAEALAILTCTGFKDAPVVSKDLMECANRSLFKNMTKRRKVEGERSVVEIDFTELPEFPRLVDGDVKVQMFWGAAKDKFSLGYTWFNTAFVENGVHCVEKDEIDKAKKKKALEDLRLTVQLSPPTADTPKQPLPAPIQAPPCTPAVPICTASREGASEAACVSPSAASFGAGAAGPRASSASATARRSLDYGDDRPQRQLSDRQPSRPSPEPCGQGPGLKGTEASDLSVPQSPFAQSPFAQQPGNQENQETLPVPIPGEKPSLTRDSPTTVLSPINLTMTLTITSEFMTSQSSAQYEESMAAAAADSPHYYSPCMSELRMLQPRRSIDTEVDFFDEIRSEHYESLASLDSMDSAYLDSFQDAFHDPEESEFAGPLGRTGSGGLMRASSMGTPPPQKWLLDRSMSGGSSASSFSRRGGLRRTASEPFADALPPDLGPKSGGGADAGLLGPTLSSWWRRSISSQGSAASSFGRVFGRSESIDELSPDLRPELPAEKEKAEKLVRIYDDLWYSR